MDDNSRLMGTILDKKIGNYDTNYKNFVSPAEITVTITLEQRHEAERHRRCQQGQMGTR